MSMPIARAGGSGTVSPRLIWHQFASDHRNGHAGTCWHMLARAHSGCVGGRRGHVHGMAWDAHANHLPACATHEAAMLPMARMRNRPRVNDDCAALYHLHERRQHA